MSDKIITKMRRLSYQGSDELVHLYHLAYAVRFQRNAACDATIRRFVDMFIKEHGIGALSDIMHGSYKDRLSEEGGSDYMFREMYKVIMGG